MSLSAVTQPHLYLDLSGNWQFKTDSQNRGEQEGWFEQDYDDSAWDKIPVPGFWERHGYQGYNGYAWYRTEIEVSESFHNQPVYLALGGMDDAFDMWIDGQHLGHFGDQDANETYYLRKSVHDLTDVLQPGRHLLVFRLHDWAGAGGIHRAPVALGNDTTLFMTRVERIKALSRRDPNALWPYWVRDLGQAWTVIGLPDATAEGLVSHDGMLGANTWPFTLSIWLHTDDGAVYAPEKHQPDQLNWQLEEGFLPLPELVYGDRTLQVQQSYACVPTTEPQAEMDVSGWNEGTLQIDLNITSSLSDPIKGNLYLAVRPYQVNSKIAELTQIEWDENREVILIENRFPVWCGPGTPHELLVNPTARLRLEQSPGDISEQLGLIAQSDKETSYSTKSSQKDTLRMTAGAFSWEITLKPGGNRFQFQAPLNSIEKHKSETIFAPSVSLEQMAERWEERLKGVELHIPDRQTRNAYYASLAYIFINADQGMPHPGPLAYDLFWYRDTAYMLAALLRNGQFDFAKRVIVHLMAAQRENGEFPPIFDLDYKQLGTREWDSQGQALFSLAEYVLFSGDTSMVRQYWPKVEKGVAFLDSLQASTDSGILPPSWSAEDLGSENWHHYWDDFWAICGLKHIAKVANRMGWSDRASQLSDKASTLTERTRTSFTSVMSDSGIRWIPNGPEDVRGSSMARGSSPGLWPGGALNPDDPVVRQSFDYYWQRWIQPYNGAYLHHQRFWPYAFELGKCFLRLDQPQRAHRILDWHLAHQTLPGTYAWAEVLDTTHMRFAAGDMPHAWVAADYINLVRGLLVYEKDDSLFIGAGIPLSWLKAQEAIGVSNAYTRFGVLGYKVNYDQNTGELHWKIEGDGLTAEGIRLKIPKELRILSCQLDGDQWKQFSTREIQVPSSAEHVIAKVEVN